MTDTSEYHPIFDEVAKNFEEKEGYRLFTLVVEEDIEYEDEMIPVGHMPTYDDFTSSFPNEWLLYHSPNSNSAERIEPWSNPSGIDAMTAGDVMAEIVKKLRTQTPIVLPADDYEKGAGEYGELEDDYEERIEPDRRSIAEALKMASRPEGSPNMALDTVMDVIFGPESPAPGTVKTFYELEMEDQRSFIEDALLELKQDESIEQDEITPHMLVERAVALYDEGPIKMLHTGIKAIGDEAEAPDIAEDEEGHPDAPAFGKKSLAEKMKQAKARIVKGKPDAGITIFYPDKTHEQVTEDKLQEKFDNFWKGQVSDEG